MGRAVNPKNPHLEGRYGPWRAYGQAKLANFHFALGLHRQFAAAGGLPAASLVTHPGLSNTELQTVRVEETDGGPPQKFFLRMARSTGCLPREGALSQLRAATDPAANSGEYSGPLYFNSGPPVRKPILRRLGMSRAIARLWEVSEKETGLEARGRGEPGTRKLTRWARSTWTGLPLCGRRCAGSSPNEIHGASMSAVAAEAGVATGTAYTHYGSKDDLVLATYLETKAELSAAVIAQIETDTDAAERFRGIWLASYRHLASKPDHARFLLQVDSSPYRVHAYEALAREGDPILEQAAAPALAARLLPLPLDGACGSAWRRPCDSPPVAQS